MSALAPDLARQIERARSVPLRDIFPATGRPRGSRVSWRADCPLCGGRETFSAHEGKRLWHCFRCQEGGDSIALERALRGGGLTEALAGQPGRQAPPPPRHSHRRTRPGRASHILCQGKLGPAQHLETWQTGLALWLESMPLAAPQAECAWRYFAARGLAGDLISQLDPQEVRFHSSVPAGRDLGRAPALLAAIRCPRGLWQGLHATALTVINGQVSPRALSKRMWGHAAGGLAWLAAHPARGGPLLVAEGIETVLSMAAAWQAAGQPWRAIAALSLDNLAGREARDRLNRLHDPPVLARPGAVARGQPGPVVIGIDHDMSPLAMPRRRAGGGTIRTPLDRTERAERAAALALASWARPDATARLAPPGMDFNDAWRARQAQDA